MIGFLRMVSRPRLSRLDVLAILAIIGVLVGLLMPVGDHDRTHHYPPARANAGTPVAEFAGLFRQRPARGRGWELSILPDGRYSRFLSCCVGTADRESGYVQALAGHCILLAAGSFSTSSRMDRDFLPIRWEDRLYLVPADEMQEFCYAVIEAKEPRPEDGMGQHFLLRSPAAQVDGIPELPEPWAAFLRENLVIGKIVEVMEPNGLKLDLGSADGIEKGDVLAAQGRDKDGTRYVRVQSVQKRSSIAAESSWENQENRLEVGRCVVRQRDLRRDESKASTEAP
jgi:hypothetical protein